VAFAIAWSEMNGLNTLIELSLWSRLGQLYFGP
jgi:hypothetical protein